MTITKLKVYRDGKLFKNCKIGNFSPEGGLLPIDFNNTKDPEKGYWVNIFKDENKPIFKSLKKEIEFTWEGNWSTDFKKDKDTKCTCIKKEKFHFRLVFENKSDYDKVVEFFEKEIKRKPKPKTKRKRLSRKKKKTQNGGKNKRNKKKKKRTENQKKTKKESKSNEKFKKELKKCEKKCKNDDKFKKELKDELEKLDRPDLKKMKKHYFLQSCSTKCLNDQGIYYGLQEILKKNGGKSNKRNQKKKKRTGKKSKRIKKEKSQDKEDCSKVEKYFKEQKPFKKGDKFVFSPPIFGIPEKDLVRKNEEYNVFSKTPEKLPKGYKKAEKTKFLKEYIGDQICGERIPAVKTEVYEFKKGFKHYLIHDNGGRPFALYISPKRDSVSIYKYPKDYFEPSDDYFKDKTYVKYYSELVKKIKCKDVFIGISPKNSMTEFGKGYGKKFDGNTNLVKISDKRYVYVGESIFEFTSLNKIVEYHSPVGNNDVPYPYAIDEKDNYYLMLDKVIVKFPEKVEDPYDTYWNSGLMTTDLSFNPPKEPVYPNFQKINKFFIFELGKKEPYTLRHTTEPSKEYDRITKDIGKPITIEYTDGTEKDLSKKDYIKLMKDFGKLLNSKSFKTRLIHNRI